MKDKLVKTGNDYILYSKDKTVLGITSGTMEGRMLSLKNCQAIERGYDLDELADEHCNKLYHEGNINWERYRVHFKLGFQKAIEILGGKKFDELDITSAMNRVWNWCEMQEDEECSSMTELRDKHFKSLQQTKWEVEIEMEPYYDGEFIDDGKTHIVEPKWRPKFDADGCLMLKRI